MNNYRHLQVVPVHDDTRLHNTPKLSLSLDSPAMDAVINLDSQSPYLIAQSLTVDQALQVIEHTGLSSRVVVNTDGNLIGIVSKLDLMGRKVLMAATRQQLSRRDITVADVMVRKDQLHAISLQRLRQASVGDVIETMRRHGDQHLLVTDYESRLWGVIFSSYLQGLAETTELAYRTHNFKEIVSVVHRHDEVG